MIDVGRSSMVMRTGDWLRQAEKDIEKAKLDLEARYYEWACFTAQQAAEKAIKAVFQRMGAEAWGHSVADLLTELSKKYNIPEKLSDEALELDKAYIPTRYPNAHPSGSPRSRYTKEEARRLIGYGERIVKFCSNLLSKI